VLRGDDGEIRVGERSSIQDGSVLHTTRDDPTVVGNECVIGHLVHLEGCTIEDRALVGNMAMVLHRSVVGTGAVVGANSVVLYDVDVPPGALAVGSPAVIKPDKARLEDIRRAAPDRLMRAFVVTVPASESELAADVLWSLGAAAIEERDAPTDSTLVELVTVLGDDELSLTASAESFPTRWRWHVAELDESVMDSWRAHAVPSWIASDLVVVPAWTSFDTETRPGLTVVRIDPGAAFGLGDHPTTIASLRAMRAVQWPGASILDVGCGSGVLGIAA
jgi:carbonic anhydrase/acetyltransferase-like protein (isoleucine patch superfamily)